DAVSVDSHTPGAAAGNDRVDSRLSLPDVGGLLFFRLDTKAAGFTILFPIQPYLVSVDERYCYRNSCSLPSARQRETAGKDASAGCCDRAWTAAVSAAIASSFTSRAGGAFRARKESMNPVSRRPSPNTESFINRRKKARLVRTPATWYSSS